MISVQDISKAFNGKPILKGVSLELQKGTSTVVIGPSGTGKSLLLKCILGLVPVDNGAVRLNGAPLDASTRPAFLDRFGMLFQGAALFDSLPIWENVAFRHLRHVPRAEARALALDKLRDVGLGPDVADKFPAEISGGMQKRVGLARAIASEPEVMFFDEPTAGLDPVMAGTINALIGRIVRQTQATALTITHDMTTVRSVADTVVMLYAGEVVWQGTPQELDSTSDPYVTQFIHGRSEGPIHPAG